MKRYAIKGLPAVLDAYNAFRSCQMGRGWNGENRQAVNGLDQEGVTALLNSMRKLKPAFRYTPFGGSTITLDRSSVSGENSAELLGALFETYFEHGGLQVMPNVVDQATLLDAKVHPEQYGSLVVRVTGYSARFIDLRPELQDIIIARTEHATH